MGVNPDRRLSERFQRPVPLRIALDVALALASEAVVVAGPSLIGVKKDAQATDAR